QVVGRDWLRVRGQQLRHWGLRRGAGAALGTFRGNARGRQRLPSWQTAYRKPSAKSWRVPARVGVEATGWRVRGHGPGFRLEAERGAQYPAPTPRSEPVRRSSGRAGGPGGLVAACLRSPRAGSLGGSERDDPAGKTTDWR